MKERSKEVKDKKIRLFKLTAQSMWSFDKVFKKYIHSEKSGGLWAYVRWLSENERLTAKSVQIEQTILFKVTANPKLTSDLYIEFGDKTYSIVSIDPYEFNKTDLVIRANAVSPPIFDEVEYDQY